MPQPNRVIHAEGPDAPTTAALRRRLEIAGQLPSPGQSAPNRFSCLLCGCNLNDDPEADRKIGACSSCKSRPEARNLKGTTAAVGPRGFTDAEKSMVRKMHGYIPSQQLLGILNERLKNDLGPNAKPYTAELLHAEIMKVAVPAASGGAGWAALRKMLAHAKAAGTLDLITDRVIGDFAVVFMLTPKQVIRLKDVLLSPEEDS